MAIAFVAGMAGFAVCAAVAWDTTPTTVDLARAERIARIAVPLDPATPPDRKDGAVPRTFDPDRDAGPDRARPPGRQPSPDYVSVTYDPPAGQVTERVEAARRRLADDGWTVYALSRQETETAFWAARDDVAVRVSATGAAGGTPLLWVRVHGPQPRSVTPIALAGLATGATAGWLFAVALLRAFQAALGRRLAWVVAVGLPSLVFNTTLAVAAGAAVVSATLDGWSAADATAAAETYLGAGPLTMLGVSGGLVAVAALAWAPTTGRAPTRDGNGWRTASRTLITAHLAFAGGSAAVLLAYLVRLRTVGGDQLGMIGGTYDPSASMPFGDSVLNPLLWIWAIAGLLYLLGLVLGPALLLRLTPTGGDAVSWYLD